MTYRFTNDEIRRLKALLIEREAKVLSKRRRERIQAIEDENSVHIHTIVFFLAFLMVSILIVIITSRIGV